MKSDFRETVKKEKIDYRHYISVGLTLVFIAFGIFVFPNAICRLYESVRDLITSFIFEAFAYYGLRYVALGKENAEK